MDNVYSQIKKDKQVWKFCFYGFFKNLRFFEPYLIIYLLGFGISLFEIGILYSIKELLIYIFEVPSGVFADYYGKKKELMICFLFYIISFILFFIGSSYGFFVVAMIFFGLGEAFRSGTHKAMIYSYLERNDWFSHKTFVYGRTRSFSLLGSAISSLISIIFVLNLPSMRWIFLISAIPYLIDFLLIWSYPQYLNGEVHSSVKMQNFISLSFTQGKSILRNKSLKKVILSSSVYNSFFECIKDYIQPILQMTLIISLSANITSLNEDAFLKVSLGIIYFVFNLFSAIASKRVYKLNKFFQSQKLIGYYFDIFAISLLILSICIRKELNIAIMILYFFIYIFRNTRKPLIVDVLGDVMDKKERATVLSVDSQLKAVFVIILAPILGIIADKLSIDAMFLLCGACLFLINRFLCRKSEVEQCM